MLNFSNYFRQFALLVLLNFAFNAVLFIVLRVFHFMPPSDEPLGAADSFILYNNLLKSFLTVAVIGLFRNSRFVLERLPDWAGYLVLAVALYLGQSLVNAGFGITKNDTLNLASILWSPSDSAIFRLNMVVSGLVVYGLASRQERRQLQELQSRLELSELKELKTKAELEALQAKVNPHFLYNSLNSIHTLIEQQPARAQEMTLLLSKLFRLSVDTRDTNYWTVREELELVETYLSIEKVRFGDRLSVEVQCPPELMGRTIPRFILQPIAENAVQHGIAKIATKGCIRIAVSHWEEGLELQLHDNGPAFTADLQSGHGLKIVQDKVRLAGGAGSCVELINPNNNEKAKYVSIKLTKRENTHH
jgi:two-component system, LytTR family, sensor kinase